MANAYFMFFAVLFVDGVFSEVITEKPEYNEGDTVTMSCCITNIETDDLLEWTFESRVIATIEGNNALLYDDDALFKDRLKINEQTGDLTVRNTRTKHSGLYEVTVTNKQQQQTTRKRFSVTILDPMPKEVSVTEGEPAKLQPDIADIQDYGVIEWTFENANTPIAKFNKQKDKVPSYYGKDKFGDRLSLDETGLLTITETKTNDSGLYKIEVTLTNAKMKYRTFRVVVSEAGPSVGLIVGIVVALLVILIVAGICIYQKKGPNYKRSNSKDNGK